MLKLGEAITRKRKLILVVAVLLLIPSVLGMIATRINYDVLSYLPDDIQTIKGQDILLDDFGKGGFAMVMVDGMNHASRLCNSLPVRSSCPFVQNRFPGPAAGRRRASGTKAACSFWNGTVPVPWRARFV